MRGYSKLLRSGRNQTLLMVLLALMVLSSTIVEGNALQDGVDDEIRLDSMNIITQIHANGSTIILLDTQVINIGQTAIHEVSIRIDSLELTVVSAMVGGVATETLTVEMERHTMVIVNLPQDLGINESVWINLKLQAMDLQSELESESSGDFLHGGLVFYMRPHTPLANFTFIAILPSHASLSHESSVPLFPNPDANFTDGESMAFVWYIPSLQPGQESAFIVRYQEPTISVVNGEDSLFILSLIGLLGVFVGIGVTKAGPIIVSRVKRTKIVEYHGITQEEEIIMESIKSKGGSSSQKELYQHLNIGESKLSLILTGLEERGLVKRFREGRQNIVHIIEESE